MAIFGNTTRRFRSAAMAAALVLSPMASADAGTFFEGTRPQEVTLEQMRERAREISFGDSIAILVQSENPEFQNIVKAVATHISKKSEQNGGNLDIGVKSRTDLGGSTDNMITYFIDGAEVYNDNLTEYADANHAAQKIMQATQLAIEAYKEASIELAKDNEREDFAQTDIRQPG